MKPKRIDVLANRERRREARRGQPVAVVVIGDTECPLPSEFPIDVLRAMERMSDGDVGGLEHAVKALLGPDAWANLEALLPTVNDLQDILEGASEAMLTSQNREQS